MVKTPNQAYSELYGSLQELAGQQRSYDEYLIQRNEDQVRAKVRKEEERLAAIERARKSPLGIAMGVVKGIFGGASAGSAAGPWGALIGAGVGGVSGGIAADYDANLPMGAQEYGARSTQNAVLQGIGAGANVYRSVNNTPNNSWLNTRNSPSSAPLGTGMQQPFPENDLGTFGSAPSATPASPSTPYYDYMSESTYKTAPTLADQAKLDEIERLDPEKKKNFSKSNKVY